MAILDVFVLNIWVEKDVITVFIVILTHAKTEQNAKKGRIEPSVNAEDTPELFVPKISTNAWIQIRVRIKAHVLTQMEILDANANRSGQVHIVLPNQG